MGEEENEQLTEEQIKLFRQHFDNFDLHQEGAIRRSELGTVLRACGQIPTEGWLHERMKIADPENKGIIEWEGFLKIAHLSTLRGNPDDDLLEAFRRFDKNHSGVIRSSELRIMLTTMGEALTDEEVEELISDADPLSTGEVNYEALARTLIYGPD